jgi:hypothetical protein
MTYSIAWTSLKGLYITLPFLLSLAAAAGNWRELYFGNEKLRIL